MITKIQREKYNFEIVSENEGEDVCFFIKAIDRHTRRFSCINNLNMTLSEFDVDIDDPNFEDSMWVVTKKEAGRLEAIAKQLLSDSHFSNYLERKLDEDRMAGEWENKTALT